MKGIEKIHRISVIGAGSWGTTIARLIGEIHPEIQIKIWAYEKKVVASINNYNENFEFLPGVKLSSNISATNSMHDALAGSKAIILATPSKVVFDTAKRMEKYLEQDVMVGILSKGFCKHGGKILTISQALATVIPRLMGNIAALYGPSHAEEVSKKFHTCINVASPSEYVRNIFVDLLSCEYLQCRQTDDIIGVELGGTLKNPAAIAAGMISMLPGCGDNMVGALISESLKEMLVLGSIFGVRDETMVDISGLGDLVTTALSDHSRNRRFGKDVASQILNNQKTLTFLDKIVLRFRPASVIEKLGSKMHYLAEGAYAIEPLIELADEQDLSIPVYRSLYEVLLNKKAPSLLIETIKNPHKFDELYRKSKRHGDKIHGFDRLSGKVFSDLIVKKTMEKLSSERAQAEGLETVKTYLSNNSSGENKSIDSYELGALKNISKENFTKISEKLSYKYIEMIADNFRPIFSYIFFKALDLLKLITRSSDSEADMFSINIGRMNFLHDSGSLLYIAEYRSPVDFIYPVFALYKSGLNLPRFFVHKDAVTSSLAKWIIKGAGGFIVDPDRMSNPIYRETLMSYISVLLNNGIAVLYFAENHRSAADSLQYDDNIIENVKLDFIKSVDEIILIPFRIHGVDLKKKFSLGKMFSQNITVSFSGELFVSDMIKTEVSNQDINDSVFRQIL